ncbi:hypothetical protein [Rhodococcus sp. BH5]|nr:hypothetical protein [Rhodococcus sp. BH5]
MGSHPRSIMELLNIAQTPDEESEVAFEQDAHVRRGVEYVTEHSV